MTSRAALPRTALVTGAARRIGAAIARALAAEGWQVIAHYNSSRAEAEQLAREIGAAGGRIALVAADLALPDGPEHLVAAARALSPRVGLLVNNASQFAYDDLETLTAASLERSFAINARAPLLLAKRFAEELVGDGPGLVVNLLDNKVFRLNPDYLSYTIAKFALLGATQCLAQALSPRVRVNGIAPGITLISGDQSQEGFERAHKLNLTRRGCTPEDIARTVLYMAATPALTGEIITLDGGQNLMSMPRDVAFLVPGEGGCAMTIERFELFLEELVLEARIGAHDFEQHRPQRVLVDIRLELDPAQLARRDALADTLDYDFLREEVQALAASRHFQLQETLASEIVALIAARPQVRAAEVATRKPDVYPDARAVGCRLAWRRAP